MHLYMYLSTSVVCSCVCVCVCVCVSSISSPAPAPVASPMAAHTNVIHGVSKQSCERYPLTALLPRLI